jgi:hypothetical protein
MRGPPTVAVLHHRHPGHEFRMTLFCLLCVVLTIGGLAFRREALRTLEGLLLQWFGVRVRAVRRPASEAPAQVRGRASPPAFLPPPRVVTRPRHWSDRP